MSDCSRIQQYAEALRPFIESDEDFHRAHQEPTMIPQEVYERLSRWISDSASKIMWVEGPAFSPGSTALSKAALEATDKVLSAGIPCISYFCKSRSSFARSNAGGSGGGSGSTPRLRHRDDAVISLCYSMIRQLAYVLPLEGFKADKALDANQFEKLDGTLHSLPTALNIMNALFEYAPPVICFVIDGLQDAGDRDSIKYLWNFIILLREQMKDSSRVCKILFTTDGRSEVLDRGTEVRERVDASRPVQARGGRSFPGGVYI
ncbi:uncharacterized protein PODANS_5_10570 [Podospora anserina S mat+]|uniref:Podospora anserina S mat+ genomic DNA chromosome 5, supercontig 10 n=1 Tax=Podospora anserina (strain S / ATCC MYA-4624 / DSM 980 / FGSC 10383) TaxID=515849 RepID=B2APC7_PODAN|nr:uncharacterized protein PODANS_5_10570 [Podospora anserina S mat+]CAP65844.1 unnamed protein product [Podospora anserina S mat+]CDP30294.1 Putative protein of unknown function [Podospora anserina S mat+]